MIYLFYVLSDLFSICNMLAVVFVVSFGKFFFFSLQSFESDI